MANNERKSFKELIDIYLNKLDINNSYLSYNQYISLLKSLKNDFPNYLDLYTIGKTYEGNDMPLIIMKSPLLSSEEPTLMNSTNINFTYLYPTNNNTNTNIINSIIKSINNSNFDIINKTNNTNSTNQTYIEDSSSPKKSGIFFNGMHNGNEPETMMINIYLILHLLSLPKTYLHLFLSTTNIYFLPIINIDAYKYNSEKYFLNNSIDNKYIRKNRKPNKDKFCSNEELGVDLNKNYDFSFDNNDNGPSSSPCFEEYKGEYPFSEPETKNIKDFVESHPDIKIVFNYNTKGNKIINSSEYLKSNESLGLLQKDYPIFFKMFKDFKNESNFSVNFLYEKENNISVRYMANEEISNWFLLKKKILSFSPKLYNKDQQNINDLYHNKNSAFDILEKNLYGALYGIQKSMFYFKTKLIKAEYSPCLFNNRYEDIYSTNKKILFENSNLKDFELRYCFSDEMILNTKIKLTNYGFGTYFPGIEFNYNIPNNDSNSNQNTKKYFYFLTLDLKIDLNDIRSICYWSINLENYSNSTLKNNKTNFYISNKTKNDELKIRCTSEIKDMRLFIDTEIKPMESILLNIQIIVKADTFMERKKIIKKNFLRFLDLKNISNINNTNINNTKSNQTNNLIKIFTKQERTIKSEKISGEIIEWKFNSPSLTIKLDDFIESKNIQLKILSPNPFRYLSLMMFITTFMIFYVFRRIRPSNMFSHEERRVLRANINNIPHQNSEMNNNQNVNIIENEYQFDNRNEDHHNAYQVPRDESYF